MLSPVFSGLSRVELAHVRRCQSIAQIERLSVVSQGVLASPAAGAPAGASFWLVGSPSSGAVSFVWLSASGRRLLCGCPRRRGGALSCAHAQCVRLWLLSAAGVAVPSFGLGAAAPDPAPDPDPAPVPPAGALAVPVAPAPDLAPVVVAALVAPTGEPVCPCPGCGELAPVAVVVPFGVCASCLDLEADAAQVARPVRCARCSLLAVGETPAGAFCGEHLQSTLHEAQEHARYAQAERDATPWAITGDFEYTDEELAQLDAAAEWVPSPARCPRHPWLVASGESASGLVCSACKYEDKIDRAEWQFIPAGANDPVEA